MPPAAPAEETRLKPEVNGLAQLLSSLDIKTAGSSQAGAKPIDARAAQVLAEKLSQILGEDGAGPAVRRNEKGQVLNEEGLPVIEITESASANQPIPSAGVPQVTAHVPLSALTDAQKAARKREVDRILDELEKEEEEEERKKGAVAQADAAEITKKERERAMENMAKALAATNRLQLQQHRAQVANAQPTQAEAIPSPSTVTPTQLLTRPSKKVKFTDDAVKELEAQGESVDMGDVIMGRPRPKPDLSASLADQPLKLHVVERAPTNLHAGDGAKVQVVEDSDDETDDELDDADFFTVQAEEHALGLGEEGDGTDGIEDDDEGFESGEDFDSAMLQRDAAAMYYSKRQDLRAGTGAFAGFGQIAIPAEGWDAEDVDPFGSGERKKTTVSRFKSARVTRTFLTPTVLPPGTAVQDKDLVGLVRNGKLDGDGELVVNEDDNIEDEDNLGQRGHEMIEALKRGETIISPTATTSGSKPPSTSSSIPPVAISNSAGMEPEDSSPKVSKFKAARQAAGEAGSAGPALVHSGKAPEQQTRKTALSTAVTERPTRGNGMVLQAGTHAAEDPETAPTKVSRFKARRGGE